MKKIKWLYSVVISTAFMLIVAWVGAFFVSPSGEWYLGLFKPHWILPNGWFSCFMGVTYCIIIAVVSQLVMHNCFMPYLLLMGLTGLLTALWPLFFFGLHNIALSLAAALTIVILNFIFFAKLLKCRWPLSLVYLPALIWYCYLFILNYAVLMLN